MIAHVQYRPDAVLNQSGPQRRTWGLLLGFALRTKVWRGPVFNFVTWKSRPLYNKQIYKSKCSILKKNNLTSGNEPSLSSCFFACEKILKCKKCKPVYLMIVVCSKTKIVVCSKIYTFFNLILNLIFHCMWTTNRIIEVNRFILYFYTCQFQSLSYTSHSPLTQNKICK